MFLSESITCLMKIVIPKLAVHVAAPSPASNISQAYWYAPERVCRCLPKETPLPLLVGALSPTLPTSLPSSQTCYATSLQAQHPPARPGHRREH